MSKESAEISATPPSFSDITALKRQADALSAKFDAWQSAISAHVEISERAIDASERAMDYSNYLLGALALSLAVAAFLFQKWANQSKKDAVEEAVRQVKNEMYEKFADGILEMDSEVHDKIINIVTQSRQFAFAVQKASVYNGKAAQSAQDKDTSAARQEILLNSDKIAASEREIKDKK